MAYIIFVLYKRGHDNSFSKLTKDVGIKRISSSEIE